MHQANLIVLHLHVRIRLYASILHEEATYLRFARTFPRTVFVKVCVAAVLDGFRDLAHRALNASDKGIRIRFAIFGIFIIQAVVHSINAFVINSVAIKFTNSSVGALDVDFAEIKWHSVALNSGVAHVAQHPTLVLY